MKRKKYFCKEAEVLAGPVAGQMLEEERQYQKDFDVRCDFEVDGCDDFIFVNRFGHPQHQGTLNKALSLSNNPVGATEITTATDFFQMSDSKCLTGFLILHLLFAANSKEKLVSQGTGMTL